jgi:hypothetical protein
MSDVARKVPAITSQRDTLKPSPEVFVSLAHIEANDNETNAPPQQPEPRMFEMPAAVWRAMITCYTIFLLALLGATGGAHAAFAIAISAVYVTMFFGTARAMLRQSAPQPRCALERPGAALQTAFGPLTRGEVYAQVLIVPAAVAAFGIAIASIGAVVI